MVIENDYMTIEEVHQSDSNHSFSRLQNLLPARCVTALVVRHQCHYYNIVIIFVTIVNFWPVVVMVYVTVHM